MTKTEIKQKAVALMDMYGLIEKGWHFEFGRASMTAVRAKCMYHIKTIRMSPRLAEEVDAPVVNTILHEIAHAMLPEGYGHNRAWRNLAIRIGCNGERCTGPEFERGASREDLAIGQHVKVNPDILKKPRHKKYVNQVGVVQKVNRKNVQVAFVADHDIWTLGVPIQQVEIVKE